jgi:hypothetical protein
VQRTLAELEGANAIVLCIADVPLEILPVTDLGKAGCPGSHFA